MRALAPLLAATLAACFSPSYDHPACPTGECPDGLVCEAATSTCVAPGTIDAAGGDAPVDACAPVCVADRVERCGAVVETCAAGCAGARCLQLLPSNGLTEADDLAGADLELSLLEGRLYIVNTDTGEIRHYPLDGSGGGTQVRAALAPGLDPVRHIRFRTRGQAAPGGSAPAPELAIFGVRSLTVPSTTIVRPIGARALAIIARGPITIAGELDAGAGRFQNPPGAPELSTPGPGGGRGATGDNDVTDAQGCAAGGTGSRVLVGGNIVRDTGGGGGGLGTAGGDGGPASMTNPGGAAVGPGALDGVCRQTALTPLRGGSGGGAGHAGNLGGGGGGALQLTSLTSIAVLGGTLYAGGAGGDGVNSPDGGGGGGSGGAILLEAPSVTVSGGSITAGGGGGGAGLDTTAPGENGQRDGTAAQGSGNGGRGATGGDAGAGEVLASDGAGNLDGTGGGGGGAGIVHLRALSPPAIGGMAVVRPRASTSMALTEP